MMKPLPILLLLLILPVSRPALADGEIGVFFTKVNAYIYPDGPGTGKRILVRPREAFTVVNLTTDVEERPWLRIIYPKVGKNISGEGWSPLAPHEIMSSGTGEVQIFPHTLENPAMPVAAVKVPATSLELLNVTQASTRFPEVLWQKVRYQAKIPIRPWIRASTGIYRPGKNENFINRVYTEMVSRNVKKEKQLRLLSGVVRVGDSTQEVKWAMGAPVRIEEEAIADVKSSTWHYPSLTVHFENQVVEQIN